MSKKNKSGGASPEKKKPKASTPVSSKASPSSTLSRIKTFVIYLVIPYAIGYLFSHGYFDNLFGKVIPTARILTEHDAPNMQQAAPPSLAPQQCDQHFRALLKLVAPNFEDFASVKFELHRNGDPQKCGSVSGEQFITQLKQNYESFSGNGICLSELSKYEVEALLTQTFADLLKENCHSLETYGNPADGFLGFCDMGKDHTPILLDHYDLVKVQGKLPCRFHSREGLRITTLDQLMDMSKAGPCDGHGNEVGCNATYADGQQEIHLYAVPGGRVFMFAPAYVGEIFHLPHVPGALDKSIYLEVMNLQPRVFDVFNFFSREESKEIVEKSIAETKESHRIKRSTTGAQSHSVNSRRTSESGFDTHGKTAVKVKKRCFKALGFDEYWESHGDGLQILRYNVSKAYNSHLDWIEDRTGELEHDYESGGKGGNRFATILMYMSDLEPEDGGETVFPKAYPPGLPESERMSQKEAIEQLRASPNGNVLEQGSWEEQLVSSCRTRLSVRPHSSRAVLFYSQYPNGEVDPYSLHGACPVLDKQKYAANLWVWNTPRTGYNGSPVKAKFAKTRQADQSSPSVTHKGISARFQNTGADPKMNHAKLFYEEKFWGDLGPNDPSLGVNTFEGHTWNVRVGDEVVKSFQIKEKDGPKQHFTI